LTAKRGAPSTLPRATLPVGAPVAIPEPLAACDTVGHERVAVDARPHAMYTEAMAPQRGVAPPQSVAAVSA
jgi:hypothetical protein